MKNPLFTRIELWLVLVIGLVGLLGAIALGTAVLDTERGNSRFGALGRFAVMLAEAPFTIRDWLRADTSMAGFLPDRFAEKPAGWSFAPGPRPEGYVLLSRYDSDLERHVVELVSLADGAVQHRWMPDADRLLADAPRSSQFAQLTLWNTKHYRAIHPILTENGALLIKDHQSYLYALDACSEKLWSQYGVLLHHSTESDGAGGWWVPGYVEPSPVQRVAKEFRDDSLVHLGPSGEILWQKSIAESLLDHDMEYAIFTAGDYQNDPIHLNDIEPVLADGPHWKKGDLFLSFRHLSMIMLYRPATDEIIWKKQGPWLAQHDVDILDDHRIGVFNNNAYDRGTGARVHGSNRIMVYDFDTGKIETPWDAALTKADTKTLFEGLFTVLPDKTAMVEEENSGRLLFVGTDGDIRAEYVNKGRDGLSYRMGWSRYLTAAEGKSALTGLKATCGD